MRRRILLEKEAIINYDYVDLGLPSGIKWATCNVGAAKETDWGNYYQWGAGTTTYQDTDQYYTGSEETLPSDYDTATQVMGDGWRMPTLDECQELLDNTTFTWETNFNGSGTNGGKFSKTVDGVERYVFIPAAGAYYNSYLYNEGTFGDIRSSTSYDNRNAYVLYFDGQDF